MVPAESVIFRRKKPMPIGYGTSLDSLGSQQISQLYILPTGFLQIENWINTKLQFKLRTVRIHCT
jgi:hypothetical protein